LVKRSAIKIESSKLTMILFQLNLQLTRLLLTK